MLSRPSPLRVALLCSHRAPGLDALIDHPARGPLYEIVACLSSEDDFADYELLHQAGVPCMRHPIRSFYRWQRAPLRDLGLRHAFDARTAAMLAPSAPDLIVLSSYLYLLTEPMLEAFRGRILNVHHADLMLRHSSGTPRYPGLHAVRDAILDGERVTRASVHVVTPEVDRGPVVLRSWPFPIAPLARQAVAWGAMDIVRMYASAHTRWMLRAAWGPLMAAAIELYAGGRVSVQDGQARVDGRAGPLDLRANGHRPGTLPSVPLHPSMPPALVEAAS